LSGDAGPPSLVGVAEFLLELYVSRTDLAAFVDRADRARLAAEELSRQGTAVRYLYSIFVPDDETCFYLYEAASADCVREAARRAALPFDRVSEAVSRHEPTLQPEGSFR
jgi:hypothetical protein